MNEAGAKLDMTIWHGLYAPKGTPAAGARQAQRRPARGAEAAGGEGASFTAFGTSTFPEAEWTREAHAKLFAAEVDKWAKSLAAAGIKPQG